MTIECPFDVKVFYKGKTKAVLNFGKHGIPHFWDGIGLSWHMLILTVMIISRTTSFYSIVPIIYILWWYIIEIWEGKVCEMCNVVDYGPATGVADYIYKDH